MRSSHNFDTKLNTLECPQPVNYTAWTASASIQFGGMKD